MEMSRREFVGAVAAVLVSAVAGGIGGVTARENGSWGESDDEPPH